MDVGPSLGALNHAALLTADHVLIPLRTDLFSVQALRNLGPTVRRWRAEWQNTALPRVPPELRQDVPAGDMLPVGHVVMQSSMRLDRPVTASQRWLQRIPDPYAEYVLGTRDSPDIDPQIATVRNCRSLMPLAHDARKPMFDLRPADGAVGSTQRYVQTYFTEFRQLACTVRGRLATTDGGFDQ